MALEQKTVTVTVILNLVHRLAHPLPPPPQQTPEALHLQEEPMSCSGSASIPVHGSPS
jgi:hypothetical protein